MMQQSNPVLFIFLGRSIRFMAPFTDILEGYGIEGAAFIKMEEHPHEEWIKDEVNRIQQEYIKRAYDSSGIIRVNYMLSEGYWNLAKLRGNLEKYVSMLYPSEIYTDIYWFLDDASALDGHTESRVRMMGAFNEQKAAKAQIYLLSNLDSNNVFTPEEEVLRTAALLSMFKDHEPDRYPVAPDASRYNEFLFAENAHAPQKGAGFITAGCRSLQIPKKALTGFLVNQLLKMGSGDESPAGCGAEPHGFKPEPTKFSSIVDPQYIYGVAIPDISDGEYGDIPRRAVIMRLFGKRLDGVLEIYSSESVRLPSMGEFIKAMEALPFYYALDVLAVGGRWRFEVRQALEEAQEAAEAAELKLKKWLDASPDIKDVPKRKLAWMFKSEDWPYRLAEEYLERRFRIDGLKAAARHLQLVLDHVALYHEKLLTYLSQVEEARNSLEWDKKALDESFSFIVPHVSEYFLALYKDYCGARAQVLRELTDPMAKYLREGKFYDYVSQLADFVENKLLHDMARPFTDLLSYLETGSKGRLPAHLAEWAVRSRRFNLQLKTGYVSLYTEANMYMPESGAAKVKAAYESHGLGRMNLFVDNSAGRVDVLYQAGMFGLDDLYYKDLYV